jgi:hypothetical protein
MTQITFVFVLHFLKLFRCVRKEICGLKEQDYSLFSVLRASNVITCQTRRHVRLTAGVVLVNAPSRPILTSHRNKRG